MVTNTPDDKRPGAYVRLSETTLEQIDDLARETEVSRSAVIRGMILRALRDNADHVDHAEDRKVAAYKANKTRRRAA